MFAVGLAVYGLDGLTFLAVRNWIGLGFHAFVLVMVFKGSKGGAPTGRGSGVSRACRIGGLDVDLLALNRPEAPVQRLPDLSPGARRNPGSARSSRSRRGPSLSKQGALRGAA